VGHFTSKLQPGQKETWTLTVSGPAAQKSVAEMVATLYDESLDAFQQHNWLQRFSFFRQDFSTASSTFENSLKPFQHMSGNWNQSSRPSIFAIAAFPLICRLISGLPIARSRDSPSTAASQGKALACGRTNGDGGLSLRQQMTSSPWPTV